MREQKVAQKKAYEAPKLLVYGTLAEMTKSGGKTGRLDMSMGNTRT
jgi:hypothetical protein